MNSVELAVNKIPDTNPLKAFFKDILSLSDEFRGRYTPDKCVDFFKEALTAAVGPGAFESLVTFLSLSGFPSDQ
jgi:hypothetical protein